MNKNNRTLSALVFTLLIAISSCSFAGNLDQLVHLNISATNNLAIDGTVDRFEAQVCSTDYLTPNHCSDWVSTPPAPNVINSVQIEYKTGPKDLHFYLTPWGTTGRMQTAPQVMFSCNALGLYNDSWDSGYWKSDLIGTGEAEEIYNISITKTGANSFIIACSHP